MLELRTSHSISLRTTSIIHIYRPLYSGDCAPQYQYSYFSYSFVDDLGFIASGKSVKEIAKTLEKVGKIVLKWGEENAVTYDTAKTERSGISTGPDFA